MIDQLLANRYQIEALIGQGGFATVYRAQDIALTRAVALKLLYRREEAFIRQLAREAQAIARLSHPHIVPIYDFGEDGSHYFLVMPYLPGGDLGQKLAAYRARGEVMPVATTLTILGQIANALDYAHRHGLVHRDVKPANILFNEAGQALLTDFGLVKAAASSAVPGSTWVMQWDSDKNSLAGTVAYMAPEQTMLGKRVDTPADVYALGVVAYELLAGQLPFSGDTDAIAEAHRSQTPPDICALAPHLPTEMGAVIGRTLAKAPGQRPPSAGDVVAQLAVAHYEALLAQRLAVGDLAAAWQTAYAFAALYPGHTAIPMMQGRVEQAIANQVDGQLAAARAQAEEIAKQAQETASIVRTQAEHEATILLQRSEEAARTIQAEAEYQVKQGQEEIENARQNAASIIQEAQKRAEEIIAQANAQSPATPPTNPATRSGSQDGELLFVALLALIFFLGFMVSQRVKVVSVSATETRNFTGLSINSDQEVFFWSLYGEVTVDVFNHLYVNSEGYAPEIDQNIRSSRECKQVEDWPYGRLLARVGNNFYGHSPFVPDSQGALYFSINDSCTVDNAGSFLVLVFYRNKPAANSR